MRLTPAVLAAPLLFAFALVACGEDGGGPDPFQSGADIESGAEVDETGDELARPFWFATEDTAVCPSGSSFDDETGLCVQGDRAFGPFTRAMTLACAADGEAGCDDATWPLERAKRLRGEETCPDGATIDPELGVCVEGDYAFGPFDAAMIEDCAQRGGGTACGSLRWDRSLVAPLPAEEPGDDGATSPQNRSCGGLNARMMAHYASRAGYSQVSRAGMRTLGTRRNGCAAWLSHAIRQSGGTMNVQTNTERFRDELKNRGWTVIRNKADLRPGDVIITKDRKGWKGHPDHVYMFAGWSDRAQTVPLAVDNQGFTHARGRGKSPIAYGLRAPDARGEGCTVQGADPDSDDNTAPQKDSCAGKSDGWYCSELRDFSAYLCERSEIASGWQCSDNTVCRPQGSSGRATLSGSKPGCFGSR